MAEEEISRISAVDQIEAGERDDEHDPAGELMEEAKRFVGVPVLDAEAGTDDAGGVGGDGDGDAGQGKDDAAAGGALKEVAVEDSEGEEAHEGADAAAGLGDLKLHDGQFDDVALVEVGTPKRAGCHWRFARPAVAAGR